MVWGFLCVVPPSCQFCLWLVLRMRRTACWAEFYVRYVPIVYAYLVWRFALISNCWVERSTWTVGNKSTGWHSPSDFTWRDKGRHVAKKCASLGDRTHEFTLGRLTLVSAIRDGSLEWVKLTPIDSLKGYLTELISRGIIPIRTSFGAIIVWLSDNFLFSETWVWIVADFVSEYYTIRN